MKVVLWCQGLMDTGPTPRFAYRDTTSLTREAAAERAFEIVNGSIHHLAGEDLELRRRFAALNPGVGMGVGDIVEVDGTKLRCRQRDFAPDTDSGVTLPTGIDRVLLEASAIPDERLEATDYTIRWPTR